MLVVGFVGLYQIRLRSIPVLSYAFLAWSLLSLIYLLPKQACAHCFYFGKLCHTGWGKVAAWLFPKRDEAAFERSLAYPRFFWFALRLVPPTLMSGFLAYQLLTKQLLSVVTMIMLVNYLVLIRLNLYYKAQTGCLLCKMRLECPGGRWAEKQIKPAAKSKTLSKYGLPPRSEG
jgi:hypothetical protein